jgi:uncharacterized protein YbjT (DUF2867 family)
VVAADLDDGASVARAMAGACGAFCITSYWSHRSPARELAQAETLARAAAQSGVRHVIWSTAEDTRSFVAPGGRMPVLLGRYNVPHFDAKGEANPFFVRRGVPTTLLHTSWCFENLLRPGNGVRRRADGALAISLPIGERKIPWIAAADIGGCALALFKQGAPRLARSLGIAAEHLSGRELAAHLSQALAEPVHFIAVAPELYRASGAPAAAELANMFQFKRDFEADYCGARDPGATRRLHPALQRFSDWLAQHARRIPLS